MIPKRLIHLAVFLFASLYFSAMAFAGSTVQFSQYDKQVAAESLIWSKAADSGRLEQAQFNFLKNKILESNFHAALGSASYGSLLDFITALSRIYPVNDIGMKVSNFKRVVEKPYSHARPLTSIHCALTVVYKPEAGTAFAYRFKFAFISDTKKLKQLAIDNKFPNTDSIDDQTSLIMIKEEATENYPDDFQRMDRYAFSQLLSSPVMVLEDYVKIRE